MTPDAWRDSSGKGHNLVDAAKSAAWSMEHACGIRPAYSGPFPTGPWTISVDFRGLRLASAALLGIR